MSFIQTFFTSGTTPANSNGSIYLNGSTQYLTVSAGSYWAMGTGDFTVEWFQYQTVSSTHPRVWSLGNYPAPFGVSIEGSSFYVWEGAAKGGYTLTSWISAWTHFAISRNSGTTRVYKNGTQLGSYSDSANINDTTDVLYIGNQPLLDSYWQGYINNFRIVKGTGLYPSTFTTPSSNLTAVSGTQILLNTQYGSSFLVDSSSNNFVITNHGGATSSTLKPF